MTHQLKHATKTDISCSASTNDVTHKRVFTFERMFLSENRIRAYAKGLAFFSIGLYYYYHNLSPHSYL